MKTKKKFQMLFLFLLFIIGCLLVLFLKVNYLTNILLAYLPATLLTLYWTKDKKWKILFFAIISTLFFAIPIEIIARLANDWDVLSIFPRIAGVAPLENILYAFFNFLWPIAFYEYFVDGDRNKKINKKFKILFFILLLISAITYIFLFINKSLITYNYWQIGLFILIIPGVIIYTKNPKLLKKVFLTTLFFAFIFFIHEILSMYLNYWWWPGKYLLPITVYGKIFPIDDVIIWYVLSTPVLIGLYEFFIDDFK